MRLNYLFVAMALTGCNGIAGIDEPIFDACIDSSNGGCGGGSSTGKGGALPGNGGASATTTGNGGASSSSTAVASSSSGSPPSACGNGHVDPGEQCDDGNTMSGDGCSADCHVECSLPGQFLDPATLHCYYVAGDHPGNTWQMARAACQFGKADLASVTSQQELTEVAHAVMGTAWIGGQGSPMGYTWSDGEPWSFASWKMGGQPPFDPGKSCVFLDGGLFNVDDCNAKHGYVCERAPAGE